MNSYPVHFVSQPRPLLFVAGLDPAAAPPAATSTAAAAAAAASSPPGSASESSSSAPTAAAPSDDDVAFDVLAQRLRVLFEKQGGMHVWEAEAGPSDAAPGQEPAATTTAQGKRRERKEFRVLLVDKDVRLPPLKVAPSASSSSSTMPSSTSAGSLSSTASSHSHSHSGSYAPARSPLSPHTPSSPLYPDGLIAPVWLRKHTDLLPSNFVLFHRLAPPTSPLSGAGEDDALIGELSKRRRQLSERGIKLTVVLLASRELLDSPSLDARLSHLRRSATLDSRSSLFVLTPVSPDELAEFSASLQDVLWESALEYYAGKEKRAARRKKARGGEGRSALASGGRTLSADGWRVRDEFKSGFWAEIRGDWETARKHYSQAYQTLVSLFSSPHLQARTKRWAEAKVLSDALVLRMSRLSLYLHHAGNCASLVRAHVGAFARLGEGWGMRPGGWEWASWEGRQWRLLAELMEHAGAEIEPLLGVPPAAGPLAITSPVEVLWGRAWYFFEAGRCAERREAAYRDELEAEKAANGGVKEGGGGGGGEERAGWVNEKKVDHLQLIVELYTKAYTLLSSAPPPHSRLALHVAHRLALAYSRAGKDELSRRFWERLGRGYEREGWGVGAGGLLGHEVRKERGLGGEGTLESLWEGLGDGRVTQDELLEFLKKTDPPSSEPVVITSAPLAPVFDVSSAFYLPRAYTSSEVPFQLHLSLPAHVALDQLTFGSSRIELSDGSEVIIEHVDGGETQGGDLQVVKLGGGKDGKASLVWPKGGQGLVVSGWMSSETPGPVSIVNVVLLLKVAEWTIELHLDPNSTPGKPLRHAPRWLASIDPVSFVDLPASEPFFTSVVARPHILEVDITHPAPAYLEEDYPVSLSIANKDSRALDVWLDVLIHPSEDHDHNVISLGDESSTSLISKVFLGSVEPSATIERTLFLRAEGTTGDRTLDFSVQTRPASTSAATHARSDSIESSGDAGKPEERTRTLVIPCIRPLAVAFDLKRYPPIGPQRDLLDLSADDDDDDFEKTEEVLVVARFEMLGPTAIVVESITFHHETVAHARPTFSSLAPDPSTDQSTTWNKGHAFSAICGFDVDTSDDGVSPEDDDQPLASLRHASPGWYDVVWRRLSVSSASQPAASHSKFAVPSLLATPQALAPQSEHLAALLSPEHSKITLMEPFSLRLTIHNTSATLRSSALQIQVDSSDAFAWAGPRAARLPLLLAGQSKVVHLRAAALKVGWVRLPRIRLWEVLAVEGGDSNETQTREIAIRMEGSGDPAASEGEGAVVAGSAGLQVLVVPP